ncbi:hypothetical protein A2331_01295 [Candidatus Falkowbacteria bacterium RIFOXYB2_FULL_34_18]|uniref:DUF4015 domain-containing protein n=1 Tax=Candidatus Falkowbacteria bacterium RIFOXYD2_FULL_34_120 TaxID=1798007 RepID=A0A1F5TPU7_9BACT|nr:MAG: hypothetical protein A2331_01295 [Candidatus Falkowbacteria bacterium RIFOXYB2_FULL_34_18]OGF29253.1 MAG: hypothetical protein A2500_05175 [Candidatus Falkowbacteria bacterium RIFOXYC12_FULL_34_55]OGF36369.1 MAG: hypothetical protein A2466_00835 [Candidatus Falkowbacteria bacterium RIFOXYC2_FULL_34_220]OGF38848.1 MAG: hypothetical protein A2515_05595 [Candidatus Falkowbacteria bacterium RIFOXYD12_FULL_34_57]OGF40867.1 MAG: hypothetical protein A2531_03820 [Candidatus Falkowbacteria bact
MNKRINFIGYFVIFVLFLMLGVLFFDFNVLSKEVDLSRKISTTTVDSVIGSIETKKTTPPKYVRGIYLTAYSANREDWIGRLAEKMKNGPINSVVIDIKDYTGYILYDSQLEQLKKLKTVKPIIKDIDKILKIFHDAGIYVIARQTVFQDPALARASSSTAIKTYNGNIWYDKSGLAWIDPQNRVVWDYNLAIAREAVDLGFDEINFDYMRYPSDGNIKVINYNLPEGKSKSSIMKDFFEFLSENLTKEVNISIDMFGLVLYNYTTGYDLGIGQRLVDAVDYFDFVCPMTYASHYPNGYIGLANPALYPEKVMNYDLNVSSSSVQNKRASIRPWLQAFNIGAVYDKARIDAETEATENASSTSGWLLWNARNYYEDHIFE